MWKLVNMYKYELSICLPAIRPSYWPKLYESSLSACSKYSFEIVFISPYDLPSCLQNKNTVKHIRSYATSVRSAQVGSLSCEGRLIAIPADDGYFFPESFNKSIRLLRKSNSKDVVVLRYRESENYKCKEFPAEYWYARHHPVLNGLNIPHYYLHAMQPLMLLEYFKEIGGFDCRFEHLAFAAHDLSYRVQRDGGTLHLSPKEVMNAHWLPGNTGDHGPIAESHEQHDFPLFKKIQKKKNVHKRKRIDFDNWKQCPEVWNRRWPQGIPQ